MNSYLQFLFPVIAAAISLLFLVTQLIQRTVKIKWRKGYLSLRGFNQEDGHLVDDRDILDQGQRTEDAGADGFPGLWHLDQNPPEQEVSYPKGEILAVVVEVLAVIGELLVNLAALVTHAWGQHGTSAATAGVVVWSYIGAIALLRLFNTSTRFVHIPKIWYHTAFLYHLQWLLAALRFRSAIIHPPSKGAQSLITADFGLATVLVLVVLTTRKGNKPVTLEHETGLQPSKEPLAGLFSRATFSWVDAIVWEGYKKPFEITGVWDLVPKDKATSILQDYRQLHKTTKLSWHLLKYFRRTLLLQAMWAFVAAIFTFMPTIFMRAILEYVENPQQTSTNAAWFYIILLTLSSCVQTVADGQSLWLGRKISVRLRAVIIGEIYAKALRRKASAGADTILGDGKKSVGEKAPMSKDMKDDRKDGPGAPESGHAHSGSTDSQANAGTIINLMAVDSFKVSEIGAYLQFLWVSAPMLFTVCIILLYQVLGYSSIASVGLMVLVMPLNLFISREFARTQKLIMAATDARIHTTNEVLENIRIIKYFAWEQRFAAMVYEKRKVELHALRNRYILWVGAATVWFGIPLLTTFVSFFFYTMVEKKSLRPSVAFPALSLFSLLRIPLDQFADMLAHVQETKVSVNRVEEFLNEDETEKNTQLLQAKDHESGEPVIGFKRATFSWGGRGSRRKDGSSPFRMIDMDIKFHVGHLNVVAGPTGSGKTSLLMALLGEMTLLSGSVMLPGNCSRDELRADPETGLTESVAYCAQQAWLVNDTIKQNILFASSWDAGRYQQVLSACALERDLEILDEGDATLVGEKGITLSGGQKQRISLARALYCNARHLLLDDCLSAVDSETAKHLFENCIRGPLMDHRTCILVTHNVALCVPQSEHVVVLDNGKIAAQGPPDEMILSGALGEDIFASKSASKCGTRAPSRVPSVTNLLAAAPQTTNGGVPEANGHADAPVVNRPSKPNLPRADTRIEGKAVGGVKMAVIRMYLAAMGPWYFWVIAFSIFVAQQVASIAGNVWIRQWANAYEIEQTTSLTVPRHVFANGYFHGTSNTFQYNGVCSSTATCAVHTYFHHDSSIDAGSLAPQPDVDALYYLGVYALLSAVYVIVVFTREGFIFWGSLKASWRIHAALLEAVTRAKFRFFDSTPLGQLVNRFSKDLEAIDQEVASVAIGVLGSLASIISVVILISIITPKFLLAGIVISILYFAIGTFYLRSSRDLKRLESVQRSPLYQQFGETLSGIITIRAYRDEKRFMHDNQHRVDTYNRPFIYLWAANRWLALRVDVTGALVAFFASVFVITDRNMDAGAAGLSLTYAITFTESVLWLVRLYSVNEQNMNSVERVKEYIEVEQEAKAIIPDSRPPANWPSHGAIQFINYATRYRADLEPVLRNITFKIQAGERVGIVGRTGAGKSSLAMALFRGLEAEEGKILIDDIDIGLIGLLDLRKAITIVPQDPTLFTGTIRSNLDPFDLFTDEEILNTLRRVQLIDSTSPFASLTPVPAVHLDTTSGDSVDSSSKDTDLIPDVRSAQQTANTAANVNIFTNLSSPISESGSNLSQGQRQLMCLARALLKSPRVLIMDEATASIDYTTDGKIQDTLREVKGSTIVTIAHRLQTIIDYDKVLVLDKGRLAEFNSPWELISNEGGIFRNMCEMSGDLEGLMEGAKKVADQKKLIDV